MLDEAGKVKFLNVSGSHLEITTSEMKKNILPYLLDNVSTTLITNWDFDDEFNDVAEEKILLMKQ